jgi:hypothetical protein
MEYADMKHDVKEKVRKNKAWQSLVRAWDENPLMVIGVAAGTMAAAAKLIDAVSSARSRRAYAKQVDYRVGRYR